MNIVPSIVDWVTAHPHYAYAAVFALAFLESAPIVGGFVPGSTAIVGVGALVPSGAVDFWTVIATAITGAIAGDGLSYWFGRYFQGSVRRFWPFNRHPELIKRSEQFFRAHGGKSVFIARFIPPVRAVVPVVAGILKVEPRDFLIANVLSAIGWSLLHVWSGVAIGKSFAFFSDKIEHGGIVAVLFCVGFGILVWISWFAKQREEKKNKKVG